MDRFLLSSYEELVSIQRYFSKSCFKKLVIHMASGITTTLSDMFICFSINTPVSFGYSNVNEQ